MKTMHAYDLALAVAHVAEILDENGLDTSELRASRLVTDDVPLLVVAGVRHNDGVDAVTEALEQLGVPLGEIRSARLPEGNALWGNGSTASGRTRILVVWPSARTSEGVVLS